MRALMAVSLLIVPVFALQISCNGGGSGSTDAGTADLSAEGETPAPGEVTETEDQPDILPDLPEVADVLQDVAPDDNPQPDIPVPAFDCSVLAQGSNTVEIAGEKRTFLLALPGGKGTPKGSYAVVFNWHGFGDTAANMQTLMIGAVANPEMPFLLVTPEVASPKPWLDWDFISVPHADDNREIRLFDAVLECLDERWGVDKAHVHSVGFSAGGVMTDLLGFARDDVLASTATFSGGYLSNEKNLATLPEIVEQMVGEIVWPPPGVNNPYPQVIVHGGPKDQWTAFGLFTVHFDQFALNDQPYLNGLAHDVILCGHGKGHTVPGEFWTYGTSSLVVRFFKDHPLGTNASPYSHEMPAGFPKYCEFHGK